MLSGMTFLITGSTGRLGCAVVQRLEELGATVVPIVLNGYPPEPKRVKWAARSYPILINTPNDLNKLLKPDYIINLHWKVDRTLPYTKQVVYELEYNIDRIAFLWEWLIAKSIQRFINISSVKIFSHLNGNPISADAEPQPISPYGIAKATAEKIFDAHLRDSTFPVTHLRLCSVASFGEHPSHLISQLYASAFKNHRITINTGHVGYIIYIDDVVDLIINAALAADKQRYIVATSGVTTDEIAVMFRETCDVDINAEYVDLEPTITDPIFVSDIQKLRTEWARCTSFESMIKKIVDWYHHSSYEA